jgi:hypothetical protein
MLDFAAVLTGADSRQDDDRRRRSPWSTAFHPPPEPRRPALLFVNDSATI